MEHAPAAADAVGGCGQDPRDVGGGGKRDPVGLAGERAAVDDGQAVRLARIDQQPRELVVALRRGEVGPQASTRTPAGPVAYTPVSSGRRAAI